MAVQRQDGWGTDAKESAEDLRGQEYKFATRNAAGKLELCGAGEKIAGVISEGRDTGYHTSINTAGQLKAIAGGAIAVGDNVQSDSGGRAVTGSTNPLGTAINQVFAEGQYVEINVDRV
jgi:hypothetical protein